jgi:hypothetical protein
MSIEEVKERHQKMQEEARRLAEIAGVISMEDGDQNAIITRLSDVKPEVVSWIWRNRIPKKKITLLDGDPGLGKSLLTLDIAARITRGWAMPDGAEGLAGGVVLVTAEDGLGDTVRPRLELMGADLSRIVSLQSVRDSDGNLRPPTIEDIHAIAEAVDTVSAGLIVVDPLMAYLPGKRDSHRDQDVRRSLHILAHLAEEKEVAVLIVRHLNKSGGSQSIYRGGGSIGIIGAARSGLLVAKDPEDENRRVLASVKSNLGPLAPSLRFAVEGVGEVPRIAWGGESTHGADSLLAASSGGPEERSAMGEARAFLDNLLKGGPVTSKEVYVQAKAAGIAEITLKRAKRIAGITSKPQAFGGPVFWALPSQSGSSTPSPDHTFGVIPTGKDDPHWGKPGPGEAPGQIDLEVEQ